MTTAKIPAKTQQGSKSKAPPPKKAASTTTTPFVSACANLCLPRRLVHGMPRKRLSHADKSGHIHAAAGQYGLKELQHHRSVRIIHAYYQWRY
jgi:hypothetical protein